MLAVMSQQPDMSHTSSPPKRPRLSLQIKTPSAPVTLNKSSTALKADIDTTSPTAFNTLSNAYAAAISLTSPRASSTLNPISATEPKTAINTARPTSLRLFTNSNPQTTLFPSQRIQTPGPFTIVYPDTPTTFSQAQTPITAHPDIDLKTPSFTFTPPQSAHPSSPSTSSSSSLSLSSPPARHTNFSITTTGLPPSSFASSPRTPRRRATTGSSSTYLAPYTHPRSLRSILRNSPLPPRTATPLTPTRASMRLAERAARAGRRVGYNDPLTQTITTERYVKSHIELLAEEASPVAADGRGGAETGIDVMMAYEGETRDGGQTPGPFEEMRRRMAGLGGESEECGGRKRKRREKKRAWVWTIGVSEDADGEERGARKREAEEELGREGNRECVPPTTAATAETASTEDRGVLDEEMDVDTPTRPTTANSV